MIIDAIVRNIEVLGEAAKSVSDTLKNKYPEIEWRDIIRTRDKIIHFYFGVDINIIWDIITNDIPTLRTKIGNVTKTEAWDCDISEI